ncbi:hypothetical protein SAMN05216326_11666 [Nitrosomonas marina]|uniref:Uncharacterized protein n=1 Tax=Nitrosomonas marina TaxID=917 RepID=A0A1I0CVS8_9PROT|nr:hypothetical protein [Nitrosomonas marina]SET23852.1 hypothetical protein SAMN05216326_11666 [Nitrosomonas marina]
MYSKKKVRLLICRTLSKHWSGSYSFLGLAADTTVRRTLRCGVGALTFFWLQQKQSDLPGLLVLIEIHNVINRDGGLSLLSRDYLFLCAANVRDDQGS